MDDIPDNLKPISIILEIIEQLETLKEDLQPLREKDTELLNCIKQINTFNVPKPGDINFQDKIYSCSYTLESLVGHLKTSLDKEDSAQEKIQSQSKSIYHLKMQLAE